MNKKGLFGFSINDKNGFLEPTLGTSNGSFTLAGKRFFTFFRNDKPSDF